MRIFRGIFGAILIIQASCSTELILNESELLTRPTGLAVVALSGSRFQIQYEVKNSESAFDGYNLYVSTATSGDNNTGTKAWSISGSEPSFIHSPDEYDPGVTINQIIVSYPIVQTDFFGNQSETYAPFMAGIKYYFKIKAHSSYGRLSAFSNEASAIALP